ncbi:hypothetical protein [Effusibacillus lacus]|uniref:Uncharacterized protein n=1 Tax=Effusibacillus lacus TaxID=1348429 RepID=A0A292YJD7_9BACL|nr:hypothetical protein [Effusibacillus lacus]TCS69544.1 hypothetical protein EDD64_13661 [Effusibacillus lacus]GAX90048.1 hypothetical protein EFBL_1674 [Effusibacillus lacus]
MDDSINSLEDLVSFLDDFLQDSTVWCRLEWDNPIAEDTVVLAQFQARYDMCDIVEGEAERVIALEFLFHPSDFEEEVPSLSLPVDPDDVEVNILDDALEMQSLDYRLLLRITNHE